MSDTIPEVHNKKKGLGRGLGSLLQTHGAEPLSKTSTPQAEKTNRSAAPAASGVEALKAKPPLELSTSQDKMWMLSIEKLRSGQYQPRKHFNKQGIEELASSIKENGILQPLVVRSVGGGQFEIIAGERRWRAAQAAGLHEVPAIIKTFNDQKTLELSLVENLQREDLNPIEEAEGYQRLISEFSLTQEKVAEKVGKERTTIANALRLLRLSSEVREMVQMGQISQGHAKVLLALPEPKQQLELAKNIIEAGLSVRKLEELVQKKITPSKITDTATDDSDGVTKRLIAGLAEEMQKLLGTRVSIDYAKAKGKMSIYFYSDDELTQIIEKLRGARN